MTSKNPQNTTPYKTFNDYLPLVGIFLVIILLLSGIFLSFSQADFTKDFENIANFLNNPPGGINSTKTKNVTDRVEQAKVQRVVDGDTLELSDGTKVRLLMVDTPETVKPNTPVMCYGLEAKNETKKQLEGQKIYLNYDKEKTDRYGRDLRFVYLELEAAKNQDIKQSFNAYLIKNGFARAIAYPPNTTYKKDFNSLMAEAEQSKTGIWGKCPQPFER